MVKMTSAEILAITLEQPNDAEAFTIRDYLVKLMADVWRYRECFDGKRPFGNSGWQYDIYKALILANAVDGSLDEYGSVDEIDCDLADYTIECAIESMRFER